MGVLGRVLVGFSPALGAVGKRSRVDIGGVCPGEGQLAPSPTKRELHSRPFRFGGTQSSLGEALLEGITEAH